MIRPIQSSRTHLDQAHGQIRLTLLAAILCIAVLTWAFLRSAELSPDVHDDYTRQLRDLREIHALIDSELLANRLELVRNYDALTSRVTRSAELILSLQRTPDFLPPGAQEAIGQQVAQLATSLARKADLIDRFKRDNAILRNSQAYFPIAAAELLDRHTPPLPPMLHDTAGRYVRELLAFSRTPSEEGALRVAGILGQLAALSRDSQAAPEINNLLRHGEQITGRLLDIDRLMQQIVALDSRQQIENLFRSYSAGYTEASAEASRFRHLLYALALLLAGFLIWLFARLERIRRSLATAHAEVSARYAAQMAAEKQLSLHATAFHSAHDGITLTDANGVILDVNPAFTRITGWERDEVIGHNPRMFKSGRHDETFYQTMWQNIRETGSWHGEIWNRNKHGEIYPELLSISAVRNADNEITNYVAVFADIRRIKAQERQLTQLAYYDALTELPNRVLLSDRLNQGIAQVRRSNVAMAICYLDLDGFKPINDTWGHQVGDEVLVEIAGRLQSALRGGDTVARLGGDEFVLLLLGIESQQHLAEAARRLLNLITLPLTKTPGQLSISASMGITLFPSDESDPDTLLRHADQAMYVAKDAGKNTFHIFDTEQDKFRRSRQDRYLRIEQALDNREFVLHFQPKVDLRVGEVIGAEALIRWQHPERGLLPPSEFLPLIEDDDLIKAVGDWVIEAALSQMEAWRREGFILPVSVNVAARQLQSPEFVEKLKAAIFNHPDVACHLELDILETAALADVAKSSRVIDECRTLGIRFALDDFGTGYSSLTYLKRLPAETIKIDQSFVREIINDSHNLVIVQSVIGLARSFQREVVAEGVETIEHGRILLQLGCERAQGYGIAHPMPGDDFVEWARTWCPPEEWQTLGHIDWHDTVYPMLIAETTHRSWVELLSQAIANDHPIPHQQLHDAHFCQFGQWLASEQTKGQPYTQLPAFLVIDAPHRRVHAVAQNIDRSWRAGNTAEAKAMLPELWAARDAVLSALRDLQIAVSTNRMQ